MAINRYDKAPEWQPAVLPYDMILKAADLTQQRWDKATVETDKQVDDLFKNARAVPTSVDEQANLPGVRSEYMKLRESLVNDVDMNPTKYQYMVNDFVSKNKPLLDKMTSRYNMWQAGQNTRATNLANPEWAADNFYLDTDQVDVSQLDSKSDVLWEPHLTPKATQNPGTYIQASVLDKWTGMTLNPESMVDSQGRITMEFGKSIDDLKNKARSGSAAYMRSNNFRSIYRSGKWDNVVPDDIIRDVTGEEYYGGLTLGEMEPEQYAEAMIVLTGMEQLNSKKSMTKGTASSTSSDKDAKPKPEPPVTVYVGGIKVTPKQFSDFHGIPLNNDGTVTIRATDGISKFGNNPILSEDEVKEANWFNVTSTSMENLGLSAPLTKMYDLTSKLRDAKQKNEAFRLFNSDPSLSGNERNFISSLMDLPYGMTGNKLNEVYQEYTTEYNKALEELTTAVYKLDTNSSEWLKIQAAALEMGKVVNKPSDVIAINKELLAKQIDKGSMSTEQEKIDAIKRQLGYKLVNSGAAKFRLDPTTNNVVSVDGARYLKGGIEFGWIKDDNGKLVTDPKEAFVTYMENIMPGMFDSGWTDFNGTYDSFEEFWEDIGKDIMTMSPDGTLMLDYYLPEDINSSASAQGYNKANSGTGSTFDENKDYWDMRYPVILEEMNTNRLAESLAKYPGGLKAVTLTLENILSNKKTPAAIAPTLKGMLNTAKQNNDYNNIARLQILIQQGLANGWPKEMQDAILGNDGTSGSINPNQPQGQQGNPLGGLR